MMHILLRVPKYIFKQLCVRALKYIIQTAVPFTFDSFTSSIVRLFFRINIFILASPCDTPYFATSIFACRSTKNAHEKMRL